MSVKQGLRRRPSSRTRVRSAATVTSVRACRPAISSPSLCFIPALTLACLFISSACLARLARVSGPPHVLPDWPHTRDGESRRSGRTTGGGRAGGGWACAGECLLYSSTHLPTPSPPTHTRRERVNTRPAIPLCAHPSPSVTSLGRQAVPTRPPPSSTIPEAPSPPR